MGTHYSGSAAEMLALNSYIKLIRATESIVGRIHKDYRTQGLTISQFGVLEALMHLGPLCQREIGSKILKSSGNITMVIDNLEKRDLVVRKRDRTDRRFVSVHLTNKGKTTIEDLFPLHVAKILEAFNSLSHSQQKSLNEICRTLGKSPDS